MKKLNILVLVAVLLLAMSSVSFAAEVKASGYWWMEAISRNNWDFLGHGAPSGEDNTFTIEQKLRTAFTFIANENLKGVLDTQIGSNNWGNGMYSIGAGRSAGVWTSGALAGSFGSANANAAGNGNIMLRQGYVEFRWPSTLVNFKVGFQTLTMPAAFGGGSAFFDDQVAAAVVSAPLNDHVRLTVGYARPFDSQSYGTQTTAGYTGHGTSTDVVFAAVPVDYSGVNITPFAAYANAGYNTYALGTGSTAVGAFPVGGFAGPNSSSNEGVRAYWGGAAFTMTTFDPFKVMADFDYGKATYNNQSGTNQAGGGRQGFLFDFAVDYTGLKMMTPELFFAYSSGESGNSTKSDKSGRMPVVGLPQNWTVGSFFFGERFELDGFAPNGGYTRNTLGYWALGVSLKDITFVDKLNHTFNLLYAKGTNDKSYLYEAGGTVRNANYGGFLTTKDSLWEVDFNTRYKIYDELTATLYLGYVNANFDKNVWGGSSVPLAAQIQQYGSKDAYKVGLGLNYFF